MAVLALGALWSCGADAALGGVASSVDADQVRMRADHELTNQGGYTIHQLSLPSGTVVREFVANSDAQVFAVAWQGPFMPDLKALLGDSFASFVQAASQNGVGRGTVTVNQPELVMRSAGHMRAFEGFAYLPSQLPKGVQVENLR